MQYKHIKKTNTILFFIVAILALFYIGKGFFIPFIFAVFIATLIEPLANKLKHWDVSNFWSSFISTFIVLVVVGGFAFLLFYQLTVFAGDFSEIKERILDFFKKIQQHFYQFTGVPPQEQRHLLNQHSDTMLATFEQRLTTALGNVVTASAQFFLVLVYTFLLLFYRGKFYKFLFMYVPEAKQNQGRKMLKAIKKVAHHYLWGRIQVMVLLAIMYIITFWIFDVRYALLLTLFGSLITIIPYIGPFLSGILPILIVLVFGRDYTEVLLFTSVILVIQLIESYVLEPLILGSEVQLNPLAVIIAIIAGGMIWGIAGMILFIPIFAMIRIICSHTPKLKPVAYLLGSNKGELQGRFRERLKKIISQ